MNQNDLNLKNLRTGMELCKIPAHRRERLERTLETRLAEIAEVMASAEESCRRDGHVPVPVPQGLTEEELSLVETCVYCLLAEPSWAYFQQKGYAKEHWLENMPDLNGHAHDGADGSYWLDTAKRSFSWHCSILAADVIQLGRLQFQKINSPYDFPGLGIQEGEMLMNIHIPALGPLDIDACRESLRRAEELFVPMFGEFKAFFCHSWLLNPVYRRYLPPTSNIIRFQNLGTVIPFHNSLDRDALYRAFLNYHEDPFTSKPRSAMQRAVQQMILRGESLSAACMLIMR